VELGLYSTTTHIIQLTEEMNRSYLILGGAENGRVVHARGGRVVLFLPAPGVLETPHDSL
jgi:hypothetical protein